MQHYKSVKAIYVSVIWYCRNTKNTEQLAYLYHTDTDSQEVR